MIISPDLIPYLAVFAFLLGVLALILEIFIVPGFGVAGMLGIIFIGWGIFFMSVDVTQAFKSFVVGLILSVVFFTLGIGLMTKYNFWQRITLGERQAKDAGYNAPRMGLDHYVGLEGITLTPLRPAGAAEVNGERLDVVGEGGYIEKQVKIRVIKVEGSRIVVREL